MHRRHILHLPLLSAAWAQNPRPAEAVDWSEPREWGVEGRGWEDQPRLRYYDRFPAKAEQMVPDAVWRLSRDSAGMAVLFATDARAIWVDYRLRSDRLALPHMPATGVSGVDLYAAVGSERPRWVQVSRPDSVTVRAKLADELDPGLRNYTLYLPLYNGIEELRIGVPAGSKLTPIPPRKSKPLVFYGTSIMHGASASRPGMALPAIVGRRLARPTINLGFSGNGRMDPGVVELLAELDPAVYCIDCLPNMNAELVAARTAPLVEKLRTARPDTPILLVEDRVNTNSGFFNARRRHHQANHAALRKAFESLLAAGVKKLFYLEGAGLLGDDGDAAVDGSHPTDLGFFRYAEAYEKALRPILAL